MTDKQLVAAYGARGVTRDNAEFYRGWLERRLLIHRCGDCRTWHHPPRPLCPECWSTKVQEVEVFGRGTLNLLVLLHQRPSATGVDYKASPHPVVVIELDEQTGLRVTGTGTVIGTAPDAIGVGDRVTLDWSERDGVPIPVFRIDAGRVA